MSHVVASQLINQLGVKVAGEDVRLDEESQLSKPLLRTLSLCITRHLRKELVNVLPSCSELSLSKRVLDLDQCFFSRVLLHHRDYCLICLVLGTVDHSADSLCRRVESFLEEADF